MKKLLYIMTILAMFSPVAAQANQDDGLYDPVAPAGSAFVRFINAETTEKDATIRGKSYDDVASGKVSAYFPVKAENAEIALGGVKATEKLEQGGYYTVVSKGGSLAVLKDQKIENPSKAVVALYNLSGKDNLSIKTEDGKIEVVAPASAGKSAYREINGVPVKLAVFDGASKATDIGTVSLKRGEATTLVVLDNGSGITASSVQATTDTTK